MIINTTSQGTIILGFRREEHGSIASAGRIVHTTTCFIKQKDDSRTLLAEAFVTNHSTDRFVKESGRKKSLTKAMKQSPIFVNNKALRTEIWKAYFDRKAK